MAEKAIITVGATPVSTLGLLGIVFVTLKLVGTISWPWLWVLAPFWIPASIALAVVVVLGIAVLVMAAMS